VAGHRVEDQRLQLADVAREAVCLEELVERQRDLRRGLTELARRLSTK
jgi:hypothetical protein